LFTCNGTISGDCNFNIEVLRQVLVEEAALNGTCCCVCTGG
jgi:hypothetical protein